MTPMEEKNRDGIVLNRMYVGDYLSTNLGHEVINMYQADNGKHYLYLNATGDFVKDHSGRIRYMLLVKYHKAGVIEVLGLAKDLVDVFNADLKKPDSYEENKELSKSQKIYIKKEDITYGGVSILEIFSDSEQQNVFITFKANELYVPKEKTRLFIHFSDENNDEKEDLAQNPYLEKTKGKVDFYLCSYKQAKASLKQYMYPEGSFSGEKDNLEGSKKDYRLLVNKLISNETLWIKSNNIVDMNLSDVNVPVRQVSLFDICQIQTSENIFSNALSYFMLRPEYRKLWVVFFKKVCGIELHKNFTVTREESSKIEDKKDKRYNNSGGRIDLLIRDANTLIAIENKIGSDINSVEKDGDGAQLLRYWNYLNWRAETDQKETGIKRIVKTIILTPKYNIPEIKNDDMVKEWTIYTYKDLYNYLEKHQDAFENDINFKFFFDAMKRHTYDNINDYLYHEMQDLFYRRILDGKIKQHKNLNNNSKAYFSQVK